MKDTRVEVVNVSRFIDVVTGDPVVQINFGTPSPINDEILGRIEASGQGKAPEVYQNVISVLLPIEEGVKYSVGTKWIVNTDKNGSISIRAEQE